MALASSTSPTTVTSKGEVVTMGFRKRAKSADFTAASRSRLGRPKGPFGSTTSPSASDIIIEGEER
jgi:hypothetical protein